MILFSLVVGQIPSKPVYRHVTNARFAYAVDVPTFLVAGREPDNGDGRAYTSTDGTIELRVFGGNYLSGPKGATTQSLLTGFRGALAEARQSGTVRLAIQKTNFFAVSWQKKGRIFYQRTIPLIEGAFGTAILSYPAARKRAMDPILKRTVGSLKALRR